MSIRIQRFTHLDIIAWNDFVDNAKNGHFFLKRSYMDYHSHIFEDYSLLFYLNDKLIALLPANIKNGIIYSHQGLSFGGLILHKKITAKSVLLIFETLIQYFKNNDIKELFYKASPFIYHKIPAQEDLYALHSFGAVVERKDINSVIPHLQFHQFSRNAKMNIVRSKKAQVVVKQSTDYETFLSITAHLLKKKYAAYPVHTHTELELLYNKFPDNIKLYLAFKNATCLGGVVLYITPQVVHTQYIAITDEGKKHRALYAIIAHIVELYKTKMYLSFGTSTEQEGRYLNENLIQNKERFGARAIVHDFYRLTI